MKPKTMLTIFSLAVALALIPCGCATHSGGFSPEMTARLDADATAALQSLYASTPAAKSLGHKAKAILIFPNILKGGFMFGGKVGNGVRREHGRTVGYYNITAASYGFQAGVQTFGYVMFLMNDAAITNLNSTGGWELGVGPSIVVLNSGTARRMTTTTVFSDVYAFVFDQTGLMAGAGVQGSRITRIQPSDSLDSGNDVQPTK